MPSRRAAPTLAAAILLAALPIGVAAADTPDDLPAGAWAATCDSPSSTYCIVSASITPAGGSPAPVGDHGLSVAATTVSDDSGDWVRWSVEDWAGKNAAVTGGTVTLVIDTGAFVPRFTSATAAGLRVTSAAADGHHRLTIAGRATPVAWNGDTDCTAGYSCGDTDTTAAATEHRFEGRTQDLAGSAGPYAAALDGAYLTTDAQARADLLTYDAAGTPRLSLGVLGNPQLDAAGRAVRNFVTLFLPSAYFAAVPVSPSSAVSTGFDLISTGDTTVAERVTATAADGGVRIEAPDLGPGAGLTALALHHRASTATPGATAPGVPQAATGTGGAGADATGTVTLRWRAPQSTGGSAVTGYRVRAYDAASGGAVVSSCETATTSCTVEELVADGAYHVAVSAVNALGEGAPAARVAVRAAPPGPGSVIPGMPEPLPTSASPSPSPSLSLSPSPSDSPSVSPSASPSVPASASPTPTPTPTPAPSVSEEPDVPSAPRSVRLTPGIRRIAVAWADPESDGGAPVSGYTARAYPAATGGRAVATCQAPGSGNSCVLTGLGAGQRLYVTVTAANPAGTGPEQRTRSVAATWTAPGRPRSVSATSKNNTVSVTWKAPAGTGGTAITGYRAELSGKSGVAARCTATPGGRACTVKKLKTGRTFTVRVRAVNAAGVSAPSAADTVKVKD